jgi:hypothetical protein
MFYHAQRRQGDRLAIHDFASLTTLTEHDQVGQHSHAALA